MNPLPTSIRPSSVTFAAVAAVTLSVLSPPVVTHGQDKAYSPEDLEFFEKRIRPALIEHCYECHSEESGKQKGGLLLDLRAGWEIGGDSGPTIIPGDPDASLFMTAIRYEEPDYEMPPKKKLSAEIVEDFETWIRRGAADPRVGGEHLLVREELDLDEGRQFWSFQPIEKPAAPKVKDETWSRNAIDRFLLSRLEEEDLEPAPDVDRATLLRRLSIDLTGLPPSLEDQEAFLGDDSEAAFTRMVDRLLHSDAFAERWGRHWLDISRYSDSSGGGRAIPFPDAWRFRDYVIEAFREGRGLDDLIIEHVAGDLLPYENEDQQVRQLVGSGFLVLGPNNYENQDKELLELEIIDEQLDTLGRAFLGMTIGCARCHDHKFDPIGIQDYYALAGFFSSTQFIKHSNVSKWHTEALPPTPEQAAALASYEKESASLKKEIGTIKKDLAKLGRGSGGSDKSVSPDSLPGIVVDDDLAERVGEWKESVSQGRWVGRGYIHDLNTAKGKKAVVFPVDIPVAGEYELRVSYSTGSNRSAKVPVFVPQAGGEKKVLLNERIAASIDQLFEPLGTFRLEKGPQEIRIGNDGTQDGFVIVDAIQLLPQGALATEGSSPKSDTASDPGAEHAKAQIAALEKQLKEKEAALKKLDSAKPKLPTAMAVAEGPEPADMAIRIRGVARNLGDIAPRNFLRVALPADAAPPELEGSGRLELGQWLTSPDNPLVSRVIANRIWQHLMGEGIVRTPDNFGKTGQAPTHPELLDYLAKRLIENDWSARALISEIVSSRAYRMQSRVSNPEAYAADPENLLYWRRPTRRIDAETLRDTILALSGELDLNGGGPSLPKGFKSEFGYEFTTKRRSVYVPVFRNTLHEVFSVFDFANPNFVVGKRSQTTIPTQSLYLLNSQFVHEHGIAQAERLLADPKLDDHARLDLAYRETLGRAPSADEAELSLQFLSQQRASSNDENKELGAWSALCRALYACIDFHYLP